MPAGHSTAVAKPVFARLLTPEEKAKAAAAASGQQAGAASGKQGKGGKKGQKQKGEAGKPAETVGAGAVQSS